ncbi:MAG: type II toxin-antitoxin system mRNA interferase toxin, RelE/StbE family [Chloroflexi bacterium]|nr:type II toxin-antitoxin system mRNA interferase toxin, RelE/StbE family [Chloroflexota bacterium]
MPKIKFTRRFLKSFAHLPAEVQDKIKKQIALLATDPRHPSLHTKPIQGARGVYEARVDRGYRITYERAADDTLTLRVVGKHDETLKNP